MAAKGKKLTFKRLGGEASIPPNLQAAMGRIEEVQSLGENTTDPEALTTTIVESKVDTDRTNERERRTVKKSAVTQTLTASVRTPDGVGTRTEVLTTAGATTASSSHLTLSDQVENLGNSQEAQVKIAVGSFPLQTGQIYDLENDIIRTYTEQKVADATATGTPRQDLSIDDFSRKVQRTWDNSALETLLDAVAISRIARIPTNFLPLELLSITTVYNSSEGVGLDEHPVDQQTFLSVGTSYAGTLAPQSSAQGSAAIQVEIIPVFRAFPSAVAATVYYFWTTLTATTTVLTNSLNTLFGLSVTDLPVWFAQPHTLILKGQQVSLRQSADSRSSISVSAGNSSGTRIWGSSESQEVGLNIRVKEIAPSIHAEIVIADASDTAVASVDVDASVPELSSAGGIGIVNDAIDNDPAEATKTVTASVSPSTLAAVSGATTVPSSGLYLVEVIYGPKLGTRQYVGAVVVNFNQFA